MHHTHTHTHARTHARTHIALDISLDSLILYLYADHLTFSYTSIMLLLLLY